MKRLCEQSLYEILEVAPDAAADVIEGAWQRAKDLYAPGSLATYSLMAPEDAAALTERIEEAKRVLLDPDARARYDAALAAAAAQAGVRIAATGTSSLTPAPPRPYLVAPARTPSPSPRPHDPPSEEKGPEAKGEVDGEESSVASPEEEREEEKAPAAVEAPAPAEPARAPVAGPILLNREVPLGRELTIPEGAVWSGEALRRARESRGLSVREVCDRTKITRYHLENIEADRFTLLPAPVYLRGIILAVARELRLDGQKVARSYLERMGGPGPQR